MMYETTVTLESACGGGLRAPSKHFAAPDPLERKTVNSPLNKIKAGYYYAAGKHRTGS
jgi:hypothetical protein